jgi:hypothetical protein
VELRVREAGGVAWAELATELPGRAVVRLLPR